MFCLTRKWFRFVLLLSLALSFSGCKQMMALLSEGNSDSETTEGFVIAPPPQIPAPQGLIVSNPDADGVDPMQQPNLYFTDVDALQAETPFNVLLKESINYSLDHGVLFAGRKPRAFGVDEPVTWQELNTWVTGFMRAQQPKALTSLPEKADESKTVDKSEIPAPETEQEPMIPQVDTQDFLRAMGRNPLAKSQGPNRQELCLLIPLLKPQVLPPRVSKAWVENALPPGEVSNTHKLSEFKDFNNLDPVLLPKLAWAYRNGLLTQVFNQTPESLTVDDGFNPEQTVTRGEAINWIYRLLPPPVELATASVGSSGISTQEKPWAKPPKKPVQAKAVPPSKTTSPAAKVTVPEQ